MLQEGRKLAMSQGACYGIKIYFNCVINHQILSKSRHILTTMYFTACYESAYERFLQEHLKNTLEPRTWALPPLLLYYISYIHFTETNKTRNT